ncbi:MAG: hypothetical protein ACREAY_09195 [Nitrososphaera sp.]|uniref:hypothetical protein n=1 Tax=Nitrososphaera sp. TaxID=1971748 RepID=UPI003D700A3C
MGIEDDVARALAELHAHYLKANEYDEGDPIFYRINYRLADTFALTREQAEQYHAQYHKSRPRQISGGFCDRCNKVVTIIPVIYGIQDSDLERVKVAESEGRLIIGDIGQVRAGNKVAMFGCKECKGGLEKYGTF